MSLFRRLLPGLLIVAVGLVHAALLRPGHEWGDDFALYVLHARNIVEGRPYTQTGYLYNPHYPSIGPPTYPPVTPLLLAPAYARAGLNLEAMKPVMIACFMLFLGAAYLLFRARLGRLRSAALVALLGLNWYFLRQSNTIGSDAPFLGLLYLAMYLFDRADRSLEAAETTPRGTVGLWLPALATGVTTYLTFGARSLGALLLLAMLIRAFWNRRLAKFTLVTLAVFAVLVGVQSAVVPSDARYLDQLGAGPGVLAQHAAWYAERLAAFWSNGRRPLPAVLLAAATSIMALSGYVATVRRRVGVVESFAALYALTILLWPSYEAERYLFPLIPLWLFYAFCALEAPGCEAPASQRAPGKTAFPSWSLGTRGWLARSAKPIFILFLAAAGLSYAGRYATLDRGPLPHGVHTAEAGGLFQAVSRESLGGEVVLFAKPRAMALFTGRTSAAAHLAPDDELTAYLRGIRAVYVAVILRDGVLGRAENTQLSRFLRAYVARHPEQFHRIYSNADFALYRARW